MKALAPKLSTVEEIQTAVKRLPRADVTRLAAWLAECDAALWDQQMDADAAAGRLDFLAEEAEREYPAGALRDWPGKTKA